MKPVMVVLIFPPWVRKKAYRLSLGDIVTSTPITVKRVYEALHSLGEKIKKFPKNKVLLGEFEECRMGESLTPAVGVFVVSKNPYIHTIFFIILTHIARSDGFLL